MARKPRREGDGELFYVDENEFARSVPTRRAVAC